jgi:hypothetical protein
MKRNNKEMHVMLTNKFDTIKSVFHELNKLLVGIEADLLFIL